MYKAPGHDGVHEFWFKRFSFIFHRLTQQPSKWLWKARILEWMTKEKITLIQKDHLPPKESSQAMKDQ